MDAIQLERRGEQARQLLANELYQEAVSKPREKLVELLERSADLPDAKKLELVWRLIGLRTAQSYIEQVMHTGTMVAQEEQRKRSLADRILNRRQA